MNEQGAAVRGQGGDRRGEPDERAGVRQPGADRGRCAVGPGTCAFNSLGWENFADPVPGANLFFAADPGARGAGRGTHQRGRLEPAFVGDATATETVDALLPLWFALVRLNGGNRKVALRIAR